MKNEEKSPSGDFFMLVLNFCAVKMMFYEII